MFQFSEHAPGILHIQDGMGVCMTLILGNRKALFFDTGYGLEDVCSYAASLTSLPLTVLLSHGHHDHALGSVWFKDVMLSEKEKTVYETYTSLPWRQHVLNQAAQKNLNWPDDYLTRPSAAAHTAESDLLDLGGRTVRLLPLPGHTPGSIMLLTDGVLLTGDNWNPETWCFFPEAESVLTLRKSLQTVLREDFETVLCSHRPSRFTRRDLEAFTGSITDQALAGAEPCGLGAPYGVDARAITLPDHQRLVFDFAKFERSRQK